MTRRLATIGAIVFGLSACSESAPPPVPAATPGPPATSGPSAPPPAESAPSAPSEPPATQPAPPPTSRPATGSAPPSASAPDDPAVAEFVGFTAPKPVTWQWQPPSNRMRAANYVVPGASGEDQAHFVVFQGIGGGPQANITRWQGQFRSSDGLPVEPVVETIMVGDLPVTLVELEGEQMATGARWFTPNRLFLAAVFEGPRGPVQAVLSGSVETVEANREAFRTLINGLEYAGDR